MTVAARTLGDPLLPIPAIRAAVGEVDSNLPPPTVKTFAQEIEDSVTRGFATERALAAALGFFGTAALLLGSVGLYGITSYNVARRTNEIGIRMALGARRNNIAWLVQKDMLWVVISGASIGLIVSAPLTFLIRSLVFGLASFDATTLVLAVFVLLTVSAAAGYFPARRAARVDPMISLRID